jgi:hypothetical protein
MTSRESVEQVQANPEIKGLQETPMRKPAEDRYGGIRILWIRVILRAMYDWISYRDSFDVQKLKWAQQAEEWLFKDSSLFNGLNNVCHLINITPSMVRLRACSMTKDDVVKMEHLERTNSRPSQILKAISLQLLESDMNGDEGENA